MKRDYGIQRIADGAFRWDVVVIGGGASGLGAAVDAASRGYSTLLLEQHDFAKGTSSRSTKLIHGGVRYLRQGHIGLVREALQERGLLRKLAPHLVRDLAFVVPRYDWWEGPFYGLGFKLYDALSGDLGIAPSRSLNRRRTLAAIATVRPEGLRGGVEYHDAQFDDARLAISLAQTLADIGGVPVNYMKVVRLLKTGGRVAGVVARDEDHPDRPQYTIRARVVINATGVFCDSVRRLDRAGAARLVRPSQGIHLVLDRQFLPGNRAIMVPQTEDGRVLFAVPWHGRVLLGTTDTAVRRAVIEPRPLDAEIDYLLRHAARYLSAHPTRRDVLSAFAGLRPLFAARATGSTATMSREHAIDVSPSGLVTITGGKWTTYRRMGEAVVTRAAEVAGLGARLSQTADLRIHGWMASPPPARWTVYGADAGAIERLAAGDASLAESLHPRLPYAVADVVWAAREEMARTVEDVLSRRLRALLLDARASVECAPEVARRLAQELGRDAAWRDEQVRAYTALASRYTV